MKRNAVLIFVTIVAGLAGFGLQRAMINQENQNLIPEIPEIKSSMIGQQRPEFGLKDIEG